MTKEYIQEFINAAFMNDVEEAREALKLGLNIEKDFNFENPRVFFSILNTRDERIVYLVLEFGYDPNILLKRAIEHDSLIVKKVLAPLIFKSELDKKLPEKIITQDKKFKI